MKYSSINRLFSRRSLIISILMLIIGITSGTMDTLAHHFSTSIFAGIDDQFFDPAISWTNKYKNCDPTQGEAFLFASTWLSWITDAWHMAKFMMLNCITLIAVSAVIPDGYKIRWYVCILLVLILRGAFQIGFTLFYDIILIS